MFMLQTVITEDDEVAMALAMPEDSVSQPLASTSAPANAHNAAL